MSYFSSLNEDGTYALTIPGYTLLVVLMVAVFAVGLIISGRKTRIFARQMAFSAMAIALAVITSMLRIIPMPMGGSVTLFSMFFITLIGYWFGLSAGITAAVAYGFLQMMIDPYIISVPQLLVDYILAFGALGLSGLFSRKKNGLIIGYLVAIAGRFCFSVLSGVIFFGAYAPKEFPNPVVYSMAYNGAYIGLEGLITVVIVLMPPITKALETVKRMVNGSGKEGVRVKQDRAA